MSESNCETLIEAYDVLIPIMGGSIYRRLKDGRWIDITSYEIFDSLPSIPSEQEKSLRESADIIIRIRKQNGDLYDALPYYNEMQFLRHVRRLHGKE
jgi:hypothetical protein